MYHVSAQGVDERMINVDYYYYSYSKPLTFLGRNQNCQHKFTELHWPLSWIRSGTTHTQRCTFTNHTDVPAKFWFLAYSYLLQTGTTLWSVSEHKRLVVSKRMGHFTYTSDCVSIYRARQKSQEKDKLRALWKSQTQQSPSRMLKAPDSPVSLFVFAFIKRTSPLFPC